MDPLQKPVEVLGLDTDEVRTSPDLTLRLRVEGATALTVGGAAATPRRCQACSRSPPASSPGSTAWASRAPGRRGRRRGRHALRPLPPGHDGGAHASLRAAHRRGRRSRRRSARARDGRDGPRRRGSGLDGGPQSAGRRSPVPTCPCSRRARATRRRRCPAAASCSPAARRPRRPRASPTSCRRPSGSRPARRRAGPSRCPPGPSCGPATPPARSSPATTTTVYFYGGLVPVRHGRRPERDRRRVRVAGRDRAARPALTAGRRRRLRRGRWPRPDPDPRRRRDIRPRRRRRVRRPLRRPFRLYGARHDVPVQPRRARGDAAAHGAHGRRRRTARPARFRAYRRRARRRRHGSASTEIYVASVDRSFRLPARIGLATARAGAGATLLPDGRIVIAGGRTAAGLPSDALDIVSP